MFLLCVYLDKEFAIDWRNDSSIRMFLSKKITIEKVLVKRFVHQAIELMSTEEIRSSIQILDNGGFDISNQTTKEQLKAYLVKLVSRIRKTYNKKRLEKESKTKLIFIYLEPRTY